MANFRYAVGRPFTDLTSAEGDFMARTGASASTAAAGYPATNVLREYMRSAWRSTTTGASWVSVNLGSARTPVAILVEGCNFTSCSVKGHTAADITGGSGSAITISQNERTGRYQAIWIVSGVTNKQYWGLQIGSQTPTDGAAYFQVGRITVIKTLRTMDRNWGFPYEAPVEGAGNTSYLPGGGAVSSAVADPYCVFGLNGNFNRKLGDTNSDGRTVEQDVRAYLRAAADERIVHFENRGETQHAYLTALTGGDAREESPSKLSASVTLREVV